LKNLSIAPNVSPLDKRLIALDTTMHEVAATAVMTIAIFDESYTLFCFVLGIG